MMAILGLDVRVLADDAGTPGEEIESVTVGQSFWVQIRAEDRDLRDDPTIPDDNPDKDRVPAGVISLPVNIDWPIEAQEQGVISFTGPVPPEDPALIPLDNPIITASFPLGRSVVDFLPDDSARNRVEGLWGDSLPAFEQGSAIGAGEPEEFGRLLFEAIGAGVVTPVSVELAGSMSFADAAELDDVTTQPATIRVLAEVSGVKYEDLDGDGSQDAGEPGLPGWQIRAYRDLDEDGLLDQAEFDAGPVAEDTTGADGLYTLALGTDDPDDGNPLGAPAQYVIVEVLQDGWTQTAPDAAVLAAGLDTGGVVLGEFGHLVTIEAGDAAGPDDLDFGNRTPATASLSGFVYVDADNSGHREVDGYGSPIELGIPNVTIGLYRGDDLVDLVTTGPSGRYHFEDLEPGTYRIVQEEQPECFLDGQETPGIVLPGKEARGTAGEDEFSGITLAAGEHGVDYNFGELGLRAACINKRMFLASTPSAKEIVAERAGVATVTVLGTDGNDAIEFEADLAAAEPKMIVTVNGDAQEFPISETRMVFIDAREGRDTMTIRVTDPDEKIYMLPGYAALRREVLDGILRNWDYGVEVVGAEEVEELDLAPGGNLTVLGDSPRDDALTAAGDTATLVTDDLERLARVVASGVLNRVQAITTSDGDDTADETPPLDFLLELVGDWAAP